MVCGGREGVGGGGGGGSLGCRSAQQTVPDAAISDRQAVWVTLPAEKGWGLGRHVVIMERYKPWTKGPQLDLEV